jgi:hypothetical protein
MYTLDDIYYYLAQGAEASWGAHSLEPLSGVPGDDIEGFTKSLSDIYYHMVDSFEGCNAAPGQVMDTATFFSTDTDNWGQKSGTIATQSPDNSTVNQTAGYYDAFDLSLVDTELATANIKKDINIFGVSGDSNVVDTGSGDAGAADMLTGKKAFVNGAEVTGNVPAGSNVTGDEGLKMFTITNGLYSGSKTATAQDGDLISTNIGSGITIFGVTGDSNVVNTSSGTAVAVDLHKGKIAWVAGQQITGNFTTPAPSPTPQPFYDQYGPDGSGDVVQIGSLYVASFGDGTGGAWNAVTNWIQAYRWAQELVWLGNGDWRLPTGQGAGDELLGICVEKGTQFLDRQKYWTSTLHQSNFSYAWAVQANFFNQCCEDDMMGQSYSANVRAVRDAE